MAIAPERRWAVISVLGLSQTLSWGSTFYLPAILAQPIAESLQLGSSIVFGAFSVALLIWAAIGPWVGKRIDQFGGRGVLAASNVIAALGLLMLSQATGPVVLFLAWAVLGLGMSFGLYEAAFAALTAIYGDKARTPITGITLIAGFASTVGWPITAWLEHHYGWRDACLFWTACHLLIGLPTNWWLLPKGVLWRKDLPTGSEPQSRAIEPSGMLDRTMVLLAIFFALSAFVGIALGAHLPGVMEAAGASPAAAIIAAGLLGPAQVAARIGEFTLLRRMHPLASALIAAASHPVAVVILLLGGVPTIYAFAIIHGAGNGLLTIARGTLPLAIYGAAGYGYRQGLLTAPARVVQAFAPVAFAYVFEWYGLLALLFTAGLGLLGFLSLLPMHSAMRSAMR